MAYKNMRCKAPMFPAKASWVQHLYVEGLQAAMLYNLG